MEGQGLLGMEKDSDKELITGGEVMDEWGVGPSELVE
jgi:hypothetical protein